MASLLLNNNVDSILTNQSLASNPLLTQSATNSISKTCQNSDDELPGPQAFWDLLSQDDRDEYVRLKKSFHKFSNSGKDRRVINFHNELMAVLQYIERDTIRREERSIVAGIAFAGPYICVNTRQLKNFLGRCKSSINGSLQQMGYVALRTKAKSRNCIVSVMKPLKRETSLLRQWTVRGASERAETCFLSSFPTCLLPEISTDDLLDERVKRNNNKSNNNDSSNVSSVIGQPLNMNHLQQISQLAQNVKKNPISKPLSTTSNSKKMNDSYSVECLAEFDDSEWGIKALSDDEFNEPNFWEKTSIVMPPRSFSASSSTFVDDFLNSSNNWTF